MFYKITYNDANEMKINYEKFRNAYIKIVVVHKSNPNIFDQMMDEIYKVNPIDVSIVDDMSEAVNNEEDVVDQAEDTLTILSNYIDQQNLQIQPEKLKTIMRELYLEALSSENIE